MNVCMKSGQVVCDTLLVIVGALEMTVHSLVGNYPAGDQMTTSELRILVPQQQMTAEPIQHIAQHLPSEV